MSDIYKLQYNGMTLAYPGWNGYVSYESAPAFKTLSLCASYGGTLTADTITGMPGDTIELAPTYDTYWRLSGYEVYGDGSVSDNTYTFGNDDEQIVSAYFKPNAFTATGGWEKGSNVKCDGAKNAATANVPAKYAVHGAHTGEVPASWYSTSNRWKPSNASAYAIRVSTNVRFSGEGVHKYNSSWPTNGVTAKLVAGSTQLNQTTKAAFNGAWAYSTTQTSNVQNNVYISAHLYAEGMDTWSTIYHGIVQYVANNNSSTWSATGYAP